VRKPIDSAKVKDLAAVQRLALDPDDDRCFVIDEWRIRAIDAEEASKWVAGIEAWRSWFRSRPERSGDSLWRHELERLRRKIAGGVELS
jgi:hypothetical protein